MWALVLVAVLLGQVVTSAPPPVSSPSPGAASIILPAALGVAAARCTNVRVRKPVKPTDPFVSLNGLIAKDGALQVLFFVSGFAMDMPAGNDLQSGALYYQFDDNAPTFAENASAAKQEQSGFYFQRFVFARLTTGPHRLAYGIVRPGSGFLAYGQKCFTIRNVKWEYFLGGYADERELLQRNPH
jgi:hypothetical protein